MKWDSNFGTGVNVYGFYYVKNYETINFGTSIYIVYCHLGLDIVVYLVFILNLSFKNIIFRILYKLWEFVYFLLWNMI